MSKIDYSQQVFVFFESALQSVKHIQQLHVFSKLLEWSGKKKNGVGEVELFFSEVECLRSN